MFRRVINILKSNSFFLFGARGTGKTKLLTTEFLPEISLRLDLLDPELEDRLVKSPNELNRILAQCPAGVEWILLDEVQRAPALLNIVHQRIEEGRFKFGLTGSSARKLKRGQANLLAGRAFTYRLHPLTHLELGDQFDLEEVLSWGSLPRTCTLKTQEERRAYLRTYVDTFLREEIIAEQIVRSLAPFRRFLDIAAQTNAEIVNYSAIARDVGADPNTVKAYFEVMEDTLVGYMLPAFGRSLRKQQRRAPKFFLFDCGVTRALERSLASPLQPASFSYGKLFEQFIIMEIMRLNDYLQKDSRLSYFRTKDDLEVDLVLERAGEKTIFIEIKSTARVTEAHVSQLNRLAAEFGECCFYCFSNDPLSKRIGKTACLHWKAGLSEIGMCR